MYADQEVRVAVLRPRTDGEDEISIEVPLTNRPLSIVELGLQRGDLIVKE